MTENKYTRHTFICHIYVPIQEGFSILFKTNKQKRMNQKKSKIKETLSSYLGGIGIFQLWSAGFTLSRLKIFNTALFKIKLILNAETDVCILEETVPSSDYRSFFASRNCLVERSLDLEHRLGASDNFNIDISLDQYDANR